MTGRQLFDIYEYKMAQLGFEIEQWEEMSESEQQVWEHLASKVRGTS